MNQKYYIILLTSVLLIGSYSGLVSRFTEAGSYLAIFPDYKEVVIHVNIAPLNFSFKEQSEKIHVIIEGKNGKIEINGKNKIDIPLKKWHELFRMNSGNSLSITIFSRQNNQCNRYLPFSIHIKNDPVDKWLVLPSNRPRL